ncbi:MAG: DUF2062 domain-containing protein [Pirellulales bacterium]
MNERKKTLLQAKWAKAKEFVVFRILRADDPPHRIALGIAIGLFVAFLPIVGVKTGLAFGLAWMLGANKAVSVPLVWLSNPVTIVPMSYPGYWLGCKIFHQSTSLSWVETLRSKESWLVKSGQLMESLQDVALPLMLGCGIVAIALAIPSYYLSLISIRAYRLRLWGQLAPPSTVLTAPTTDA